MTLRLIMAASAALVLSAPVMAAPALAVAAQTASPASEEEMQLKSEAFDARMQEMNNELAAAIEGSNGDRAKAKADTDAIITRYTPDIVSFTDNFEAFLNGQLAKEQDAEKRQQITTVRDQAVPMLRSVPDQLRSSIAQALAEQPAD